MICNVAVLLVLCVFTACVPTTVAPPASLCKVFLRQITTKTRSS